MNCRTGWLKFSWQRGLVPKHPRIRLTRLREIGWKHWNPIGVDGLPDDEYDSYLLRAAGMIRRGEQRQTIVDYLVSIEIDYIGVGRTDTTLARAEATTAALQRAADLWTDG